MCVCVCRGEWPPSHVSAESNGKRRIWVETVSFGVSHLACNPYPARKRTHTPRGVSQPFPGDTARAVSPPDARRCGRQGAPPQGTGEAPSRPRWPQRHSPGPGTPRRPQLPPRAGERRAASASPCPGTPCAGCRAGTQACRGSHVPSHAAPGRVLSGHAGGARNSISSRVCRRLFLYWFLLCRTECPWPEPFLGMPGMPGRFGGAGLTSARSLPAAPSTGAAGSAPPQLSP